VVRQEVLPGHLAQPGTGLLAGEAAAGAQAEQQLVSSSGASDGFERNG
jgi:hypothetical protein